MSNKEQALYSSGDSSGHLAERAIIRLSRMNDTPETTEHSPSDFLQGLVTQDMRKVQPGSPQWAALLSAQGKVMWDFILWADGDDILLDAEAAHADALVKRLSLYRLRRKIAIARDDELAVFWSNATPHADNATADPRLPELGVRWIESKDERNTAPPIMDEQWRAHRLSLGVTEGQAELGDAVRLWLECNAIELNGVAFDKGCYIGQENTARMNWRKKINRRMVVVPLAQANEKRQICAYPDLGLSVEHRPISDMTDIPLPPWQQDIFPSE